MKHYIIVKFKDKNDTERLLPGIKELFDAALDIPGVNSYALYRSNSTQDNRYSIMIEMDLSAEGLNNFDASLIHEKWKEIYGDRIESKAIFDCD